MSPGQEADRQREVEVEQELEQVRENHPIPVRRRHAGTTAGGRAQ